MRSMKKALSPAADDRPSSSCGSLIGWHFLYEGVAKLTKPGWSAAGFLKQARGPFADLFRGMAADPNVLAIVNPLNMWGLTAIGLGLILGCFTRLAAASGHARASCCSTCATPPSSATSTRSPRRAATSSSTRTWWRLAALAVVLVTGSGRAAGLDRIIHGLLRRRRPRRPRPDRPGEPSTEREGRAMKDETGIGSAGFTRRDVLKTASLASLAAAFPGGALRRRARPRRSASASSAAAAAAPTPRVDCAAASPDVVIAALGDVFPDQLEWSLGQLKQKLAADRLTATPETCFTGFDAYQKVLAADVDLVILASPPVLPPRAPRGRDRGGQARLHGEAGGRRPARRALRHRHRRSSPRRRASPSWPARSAATRPTTSRS